MSTFLVLIGTAVFVIAVVALVRGKLSWARIPSRKVAIAVLVGGFVVMGAGGALAQPPTNAIDATGTPATSSAPTTTAAPTTTTTPATSTTVATTSPTTTTTTAPAPVSVPPVTTASPPPTTRRPHTTTAAAQAPAIPLTCAAAMSNPRPADYQTTDVVVQTGIPGASVTATAHYKTTNTTNTATAGSNGTAVVPFRISRATPGYTVTVDVTVAAPGGSATCDTSFTPV